MNLPMPILMITIDLSAFWIAVSNEKEIHCQIFTICILAIWGSTCPWPVNVGNSEKFWPGFGSAVT